ncbi:hypothetical protein DERP_005398 [Dermatophagoides pteronyssinus]|uniref:Uncharacterized protein n=1 Tax=Dermatophagoides pteronyssinus TaxID=6956 RepID=A0ABQ8JMH9_DERPT|nr:hypothetical protein DERP_005398 [Dermatophagoides pteronyssinus]
MIQSKFYPHFSTTSTTGNSNKFREHFSNYDDNDDDVDPNTNSAPSVSESSKFYCGKMEF